MPVQKIKMELTFNEASVVINALKAQAKAQWALSKMSQATPAERKECQNIVSTLSNVLLQFGEKVEL